MEHKQVRLSHISLSALAETLWKNIWMVVAAALIFGMSASVYFHWCYKAVYRAEATVAVTATDAAHGKETAQMLTNMVTTDLVRDRIRGSSERLASFSGEISALRISNTNLITVTLLAETPGEAFLALRGAISSFPGVLQYISSGCGVEVLCDPSVSATPENPVNIPATCILLALAGGAGMALVLCLLSLLSRRVQTCRGGLDLLDIPVLAALPREPKRKTPLRVWEPTVSLAYARQINAVCAVMAREAAEKGSRVFLVSSLREAEGRTTVSANVAAALSLGGKKVTLLDCDLRKPGLNAFFGGDYSGNLPLNELLSQPVSRESLEQCIRIQGETGLAMLFSRHGETGGGALTGSHLDTLLENLQDFDYVILDSPPLEGFAEGEILAEKADGVLLVVRRDYAPAAAVNEWIRQQKQAKGSLLGCILNDMPQIRKESET